MPANVTLPAQSAFTQIHKRKIRDKTEQNINITNKVLKRNDKKMVENKYLLGSFCIAYAR